jgi:alpha-tubulin suppressor-like RCC1 family protein
LQIWSFGVVNISSHQSVEYALTGLRFQNDNGALGRQTSKVVDPANPERILRSDELESNPTLLQTLVDENFRAVHVAAGDSISIAIGDTGEIRAWGSFRASLCSVTSPTKQLMLGV